MGHVARRRKEHSLYMNNLTRSRTTFLGILVAVAVLAASFFYTSRAHGEAAGGDVLGLPTVSLRDLAGGAVAPTSFKGHPLFINMWASWCPPCRAEMPDLQRLYARAKGSGFVILGDDQGESEDAARRFASHAGVTFPILLDTSQQISSQFGTSGLPTTLVFDRAGHLVDVVAGMMTASTMQVELHKAFAQ